MPFGPNGYLPDFQGGDRFGRWNQMGQPWTPGPTSQPPPINPTPFGHYPLPPGWSYDDSGTPVPPGTPTNQMPSVPPHRAPDWKQQLWAKYVAAGKPGDWNAYMAANQGGGQPGQPPVNTTAPPPTQPQMPGQPPVPPGQTVSPNPPPPVAPPPPQGRPPMPQPWSGPLPPGWDRVPSYWERNHLAEFRQPQAPSPPPPAAPAPAPAPTPPPPGPSVMPQQPQPTIVNPFRR